MQLCSFLYCMVFAMDGNYSLHKKTKEGDADDVALAEGQNFFVPKSLIEPHLEAAKNKPKHRQAAKAHTSGTTDAGRPHEEQQGSGQSDQAGHRERDDKGERESQGW